LAQAASQRAFPLPIVAWKPDLAALWAACGKEPNVALKRQLWRQLLSLVYGREIDDDALWVRHTLLVTLGCR
jgi:hypothetical protein